MGSVRFLLVLLLLLVVATPARAEPPDPGTILDGLRSDDPREVAWAAWHAAEARLTAARPHVVPLLERLAARRGGTGADDPLVARLLEHESRWPAWVLEEHALDLAIRLEVLPPTKLLQFYAGRGRASVAALLLAHPDPPADALLAVFDRAHDGYDSEAWIALGNLMARRRTPGFAAAVLARYAPLRILRVWDDGEEHPDLLRPSAHICYDGAWDRPADFPPTVVYGLVRDKQPTGDHLVRWYRNVWREPRVGFGGVTGSDPAPDAVRGGWLRRLGAGLDVPVPAHRGHLHLPYVGRQPWDRDLTAWIEEMHEAHWRFVAALLDAGLLTPEEALDARPRLRIELEDRRDDRRHPLPIVPEVAPCIPAWLARRLGGP